ncbi:MFS transporter-like protein 64 [Elsinoe australis]|uniref:MFS transporter-like protein 64 n=1 Tax=Elsinoe australis TaxID=40998 RepID=A0A4U7B3H6_9PEZI|nr:MFS transporter-like protein 64 [Elsinoe australis]
MVASVAPDLAEVAPLARTLTEQPVHQYSRVRKIAIVFMMSWVAFTTSFSSAALFPAISDIASDFGTTRSVIDASNAAVFICLAISGFLWVPLMQSLGRRYAYYAAVVIFFILSIATAAAPTIKVWFAMRCVSMLEGTIFHIAGQALIADIFPPAKRGTAIGFFLVGTISGPALGPCIGGITVTFADWRVIFWTQCGMMGFGALLCLLFYPSEIETVKAEPSLPGPFDVVRAFNVMHIFRLFKYPNVLLTNITCGLLSFSQYSLLIAPHHLINPRLNLTTPLVSGLFYLSPLAGFIVGTLLGGAYSDHIVVKYVRLRGRRAPQDRLRAGSWAFFAVIPVSSMVYGWCLQYSKGGLAVPIVAAFWWAAGLMAAFSGLNAYCVESFPDRRTEVVAGKYFVQYAFGAGATGGMVPLIDRIGVGMATTVGVGMVLVAGVMMSTTADHGEGMQRWADGLGKSGSQEQKVDHDRPPAAQRNDVHLEDL